MHIKKWLIVVFCLFFSIAVCCANILPENMRDIPNDTMGVYQTDEQITIYEKPDDNSKILYKREIVYNNYTGVTCDNLFAVMVPKKELGYIYVTDVADDENWVQVIYDKQKNLKGWIYKKDEFQFLPWGNFFNLYGRKYGVYRLKTQNAEFDNIFSQPDKTSQVMGKISRPKCIRMTSIEGNWMLVSVLDYSKSVVTGYSQWRTNDGEILLFPDIK